MSEHDYCPTTKCVNCGFHICKKAKSNAFEQLQADNKRLEGIIARFKEGCKITGKGPVDKDCEMVVLLQAELDSANHDYAELMKERADYVGENKRLRPALSNLIGYHYHNDMGVKPKVYHKAVQALKKEKL